LIRLLPRSSPPHAVSRARTAAIKVIASRCRFTLTPLSPLPARSRPNHSVKAMEGRATTTERTSYVKISIARLDGAWLCQPPIQARGAVQLQQSLPVSVRRLQVGDIDQVVAIEKEAFSPLWVSTSFKRDLNNKRAKYLVACFDEGVSPEEILAEIESDQMAEEVDQRPPNLWSRVLGRIGFSSETGTADKCGAFDIAGYVSVWYQGDEAHITEIAVKESLRGRGIGELLLIGSLKAAIEYGSKVMTLEARVSNFIAHRMYQKYNFKSVGIRKAYYSDNREDAVIMTTSPINTDEYHKLFTDLQSTYHTRWGRMCIEY